MKARAPPVSGSISILNGARLKGVAGSNGVRLRVACLAAVGRLSGIGFR
jgi:hypothetical protein